MWVQWQSILAQSPMTNVGNAHLGKHRKFLPFHTHPFVTLAIDTVSVTDCREQKATVAVAFCFGAKNRLACNSNGWTNLAISPLERRI
jgi:hypothetical protein